MRETFELKVHLANDEETGRWYIAESDIPGLWLEADSPAELIEKIQNAALEIIQLNEREILTARHAKTDQSPDSRQGQALHTRIKPVFDTPLNLARA